MIINLKDFCKLISDEETAIYLQDYNTRDNLALDRVRHFYTNGVLDKYKNAIVTDFRSLDRNCIVVYIKPDSYAGYEKPVKSSRKPIRSAIDYDDIDLAYAVGEAIPMASPSTQDAVADWLLMSVDPEDEQFETEEDVTAFVENWIDQFANDPEYGADEDSIRDLVSCGYLDDSWLDDFEED